MPDIVHFRFKFRGMLRNSPPARGTGISDFHGETSFEEWVRTTAPRHNLKDSITPFMNYGSSGSDRTNTLVSGGIISQLPVPTGDNKALKYMRCRQAPAGT